MNRQYQKELIKEINEIKRLSNSIRALIVLGDIQEMEDLEILIKAQKFFGDILDISGRNLEELDFHIRRLEGIIK